jgi:hypothetical protein
VERDEVVCEDWGGSVGAKAVPIERRDMQGGRLGDGVVVNLSREYI